MTELCTEANKLMNDWYAAEKVNRQQPGVISLMVMLTRELYISHIKECPTCRTWNAELARLASIPLEPGSVKDV